MPFVQCFPTFFIQRNHLQAVNVSGTPYHDLGVSTTIFTHGELAGFATIVKTAKKQKQKLQDELLELNIRTEVELSETVVSTLTAEGIL